jgi:hypothetical protein
MLFLVPVGFPIGFFIVSWILEGFQMPQTQARTARRLLKAGTPPWHNVAPVVIDAIFEALDDTELFDCFVFASMENNLIASYEKLEGDDNVSIIRSKISGILCLAGFQYEAVLEKDISAGKIASANKIALSAINLFEPAIAMSTDQITAYVGMATIYNLLGVKSKCREYAKRGLSELKRMRESAEGQALRDSTVFPPDMFDGGERLLRGYLE